MSARSFVLIGCDDETGRSFRLELSSDRIPISSEFRDPKSALDQLVVEQADQVAFFFPIRSGDDIRDLKRISESFPGCPIIAGVNPREHPELIMAANRAGAAQVAMLPIQNEDIRQAVHAIHRLFQTTRKSNEVIAVAGVTGGCGATSIAINLAYELSQTRCLETALIELTPQLGIHATYLNLDPRFTTQDLLRDIHRVDGHMISQAMTRVSDRFQALVAPFRSINKSCHSAPHLIHLIESARETAEVVILDFPCTYDDAFFETIVAADHILLVGEQNIASIRSLLLVRESILSENPRSSPQIVVNRFEPGLPGFNAQKLEQTLKISKLFTVANEYAKVSAALNSGKPIRAAAPGCRVIADLSVLIDAIVPRKDPSATPNGRGWLSRAFGRSARRQHEEAAR